MPDIPEITGLDRTELAALETRLLARYNEIRDDSSPEAVAEVAAIAQALPSIGDRMDALTQAADAAAAVDAYQPRTRETPDPVTPPADPAPPADPPPVDVAPPAVVDAPPPAVDAPGTDVVAAGRTSMASIAARAPQPRIPAQRGEANWWRSLTAGTDIPGVVANARFESSTQLGQSVIDRVEAMRRGSADRAQAMIARADMPHMGDVIAVGESGTHTTMRMLQAVADWRERRAERAALAAERGVSRHGLAADTGFCAPTETIWDLCEYGSADGLIDLPEVPITRGGIRWFQLPELACWDNYSWEFGPDPDELECMDKPCLEIPCPDLTEATPGVIGACIKAGILQARQFPELVELYVRNTLKRHMVVISRATLARMIAGSTPVVYDDTLLDGSGFTATFLQTVEVQALDLRADYMLAMTEMVIVDAPEWARGAIRADLAQRQGVDMLSITDAYIDQLFAERGVEVNWIKNWQNECIGAPGAQRAYPTTLRFLIYREGTWVRGLEPVLEIDTLYDSQLLRQNKFVRLFTEQALLLANLCTTSRVVTIPICPNGATNAGNEIACFAEACSTTPVVCPPNVECPSLPCCEDTTP